MSKRPRWKVPPDLQCEQEFRRWCAEELIEDRFESGVLEEAFTAGFIIGGYLAIETELTDDPVPGDQLVLAP